ncbi:MAG: hypothetical protein ACRDRC_10195 [Pseudonocardiaceae bacterium]
MLAIHCGPGMSYHYLDDAVAELATRYRVATFQQRGLAPSTEQASSPSLRRWPTLPPCWTGWGEIPPT